MNIKFSNVTRFTLFLAHRAAVLMLVRAGRIETSWIMPYDGAAFFDTLLSVLRRNPSYPLKIVVESSQLDVRVDNLPPVSPWMRSNIVTRQRAHHFPKAQLETSLIFKDSMRGLWQAVHVAIPVEGWLQAVCDRLRGIANPIEPLSFFATEWFGYAGHVSIMPKHGYVFANVVGESFGLRQMVFKDGRLIFTRSHVDCVPSLVPSMGQDALTSKISSHIRETLDYLPRIDGGIIHDLSTRLYVPPCLKDMVIQGVDVIAVAASNAESVPPEWGADIAWLHVAGRAKHPAMPIIPPWLRELRDGSMKRMIALWVVLCFGGAGVYGGFSLLTQVSEPPPVVVPSLAMEPTKPEAVIEPPLATPPELKLDAVIYNSPQDWTVWINGEKHVPGEEKNNLTLIDVSPQTVTVHWQDGKAEEKRVLELVRSTL